MTFLVTGAGGQLGRALLRLAGPRAVGLTHADLPVEDAEAVREAIARHRPGFVLHCAAWTAVDECERDPELAMRVNGAGAAHVAEACAAAGSGLIYVSTDFVFDGRAREPYAEDAAPAPLSWYGRSKLAGERAVLAVGRPNFYVVRTSWVFGPGGRNFPAAILGRAREGGELAVVTDQVGSPTYTLDLAAALLDLAASGAPGGVYHAANEGRCSWHEFAVEVLARAGMAAIPVREIRSADLDRPAPRPAWSVLDCSRLARVRGRTLPDWRDAVIRYLREEIPSS